MNSILGRDTAYLEIKRLLLSFDTECKNTSFKKGIYIYGAPGCGKTDFVMRLLKDMNYDIIKYDTSDIRNKAVIETLTSNNISKHNVLHMMMRVQKKIVVVMDEIDGMNNGDKGGITALIKLIRQKKTKKQRLENITLNPIICIGNYTMDKKIKELMKVCNTFELKIPTSLQIERLIAYKSPVFFITASDSDITRILEYVQGDLRRLLFVKKLAEQKPELLKEGVFEKVFQRKVYAEDAKRITRSLINEPYSIGNHNFVINETDRTIVSLLYHENVVDMLENEPMQRVFPFYLHMLENMCFADYIDRITFQNQIWIFNEMSSLMKTFRNNRVFHTEFPEKRDKESRVDIRFTKILTKYSTEYNNLVFIYNLCQNTEMDRKDLLAFFQEIRCRDIHAGIREADAMINMEKDVDNYGVTRLDIRRIYRYLDKNIKRDTASPDEYDLIDGEYGE
jgi:SpoVK/Ycf46/Vps4 family AAA+-type ATPase